MMAGMIKYKAFVIIHPEKGAKLFFIFIYNIFDTVNCSFYSIFNIFSNFFNFCSCFFRSPFFFYFLSPVNLPTPSFAAPLAWSIFSSIDMIMTPFI